MTSDLEADEVARGLTLVFPLERKFVRNRLALFLVGKMPRWSSQVERTGIQSMGYYLLAGFWTPVFSISGLAAALLIIPKQKSSIVIAIQWLMVVVAVVALTLCLLRMLQGYGAGKRTQNNQR